MTTISGIDKAIHSFVDEVQEKIFVQSLKVAVQPVIEAYQDALQRVATKPGNDSFLNAYLAVGAKVKRFKDGIGAYAVVGGLKTNGRMLAPQQRFGELGTVKRQTKAGLNRGIMPPQKWLALSVARSLPIAQDLLIAEINRRVARIGSGSIR